MLRVETQESVDAFTFILEGRLTSEAAEHLRKLATQCETELKLVVVLTEVMFLDSVGEEVLSLFKRLGAQFVSETAYSGDVCQRLQLPLLRPDESHKHALRRPDGDGHRATSDSRRR
jgi:hypothetical protein